MRQRVMQVEVTAQQIGMMYQVIKNAETRWKEDLEPLERRLIRELIIAERKGLFIERLAELSAENGMTQHEIATLYIYRP